MTTEEKVEDLEFRLRKAIERISVIDAENSKLRYEFELLREKWLQLEIVMEGVRKDWREYEGKNPSQTNPNSNYNSYVTFRLYI